ncbi:MAG: Hsp20/alpha crystallin family protein [Capsulimonadaceae bacterium]|nr:Hsp20/alpha crystallin family protein [Capsulimonadaceae bacterium]
MANGIVRFDPFEDLSRLQREMNRLFQDSVSGAGGSRGQLRESAAAGIWAPAVDVAEDANEIVLKSELPGVKQEDLDIEVSNDTLTIRGEKKFEDEEKKGSYIRIERAYGTFQRSFNLGVPIDQNQITASFKDGVLTVHLPKSEKIKPKKVLVNGK